MKRIIKNPDVRRSEIISAAKKLFDKHGYEKTPVELIIKQAGIAKGTFYYYFKAKEDILAEIVEQIGTEMASYFTSIVEKKNLTAIEKLRCMLTSDEKKVITSSSVMETIHHPENRALQEQLNIKGIKIIAPLIINVLEQGYKEGCFKKFPSVECIQLLLAGSQFLLESGLFKWSSKKQMAFLKSIQLMLEQLIDAEPGALSFISEEK